MLKELLLEYGRKFLVDLSEDGYFYGPSGEIYYWRDEWGYPAVKVRDVEEGAFARGYLHCLDRFLQVRIGLLLAQGRAMEFFGDEPLWRLLDRAMRSLNFTGDLHRQTERLGPRARTLLQAYSDGFNAAMKDKKVPKLLELLGLPAFRMTPENIVLLYRFTSFFGLTSNHQLAEGTVLQLAQKGVPAQLFEVILGQYSEGFSPEKFENLKLELEELFLFYSMGGGSNGIAVSGEHSASGYPLLLSEFHLELGKIPGAFYQIYTEFRDGNYYHGFGIPGLPWLSSGRTRDIAWTYTFGHGENVDVIVETCRSEKYLASDGEWYPLRRRVERVKVRGRSEPLVWVFYESPFGVVLGDASVEGEYPSLRWSGLDKSYSDINSVREMMEARDAIEFAELQSGIKTLSLAALCADRKGNISYVHSGEVEEKPGGASGAYPLKGSELPPEARHPRPYSDKYRLFEVNPPEGFIVSANEWRRFPEGVPWIVLPEPNYRYRRMRELLEGIADRGEKLDAPSLLRLVYDRVDLCARELMELWGEFLPPEQERSRRLVKWAAEQRGDDGSPEFKANLQLFYALYRRVVIGLLSRYVERELAEVLIDKMGLILLFQYHIDRVLLLKRPDLLDREGLAELVRSAWPEAIEDVDLRDFPRVPVTLRFQHLIFGNLLPLFEGKDSEELELPGSPNALFQARAFDFLGVEMFAGPLLHFAADLSDDGYIYNICSGAGEMPLDGRHQRAVEAWLKGEFIYSPPRLLGR